MTIKLKNLGSLTRGLVLWYLASPTLIWLPKERNARIIQDGARTSEDIWNTVSFHSSFRTSSTTSFNGIQLNWFYVPRSKDVSSLG